MSIAVPLTTVYANTRNGTATYVQSDGTIATQSALLTRTDHWISGQRGRLFEPSRTGILTKNNGTKINSTDWTQDGTATVTTAAATVAGISASLIDVGATGAGSLAANRISRNVTSLSASTKYCLYAIVKTVDCEIFCLRAFCSGGTGDPDAIINFTFSSGAITGVSGDVSESGYFTLSPGVYLVWMTFVTGTGTACNVRIGGKTVGTTTGEQFYCAAAQLEAGAFPTSFIPTDTTAVTRLADRASCSLSDIGFDAAGGSIFVEGRAYYNASGSGFSRIFQIDDGTGNNWVQVFIDEASGDMGVSIRSGGTSTASETVAYTSGSYFKAGLRYKGNSTVFSLGGADSGVDTSVTLPSGLTTLNWQADNVGANNGAAVFITKFATYAKEFADATLNAETA